MDKATGAIYEPSNEFVEVSEAFALRIKELQKDVRHADSFEFQSGKGVVSSVDKSKDGEVVLNVDGKDLVAKQSKRKK